MAAKHSGENRMKPQVPLFIVRHGETDWNRERRFQGRVDIALNELGERQAASNGRFLAGLERDWSHWGFLSSPLGRTRKTMELMRKAMGLDPLAYGIDDALIEVTFGDWERRTLEDLADSEPDLIAERSADKWNFTPPGGESYAQAATRVRFVLGGIVRPSVLVTHGGVIRAARHLIEGLDPQEAADSDIPQDRVYHFDGVSGGWLAP